MSAFKQYWLVKYKIIYARSFGHSTVDDFAVASDNISAMFNSSTEPLVHVFIDNTQLDGMPNSLPQMLRVSEWLRHERLGWTIVFGGKNTTMDRIMNMGAAISRIRFRQFPTRERAFTFLEDVYPGFAPLQTAYENMPDTPEFSSN